MGIPSRKSADAPRAGDQGDWAGVVEHGRVPSGMDSVGVAHAASRSSSANFFPWNPVIVLSGLILAIWLSSDLRLAAQDGETEAKQESAESMRWNWPWRTMGGKQLWTDQWIEQDWRIQRNAISGHFRLLDPRDVRRAWGTWDECTARMDEVRRERSWEPVRGRVLIAIHGLGRSRSSMQPLGEYLKKNAREPVTLINFGYASTREPLVEHAESLRRVIDQLEGAERIDFVAHSLGNLVIRRFLAGTEADPQARPDPRLGRIVMLGPPNQGAEIARRAQYVPLFKTVTGPSGKALAMSWEELERELATPAVPFGIIAGGRGNERGLNPWVAGDDDVVVRVEETRLPGAADFRVVPALHSFMMDDDEVRRLTRNFLEHGWFESEKERQPLAGE